MNSCLLLSPAYSIKKFPVDFLLLSILRFNQIVMWHCLEAIDSEVSRGCLNETLIISNNIFNVMLFLYLFQILTMFHIHATALSELYYNKKFVTVQRFFAVSLICLAL